MKHLSTWSASIALVLGLSACAGEAQSPSKDIDEPAAGADAGVNGEDAELDPYAEALAEREYDYSAALRIAALRLLGELPSLSEVRSVQSASNPRSAYEALIAQYLADPRFADTQVEFWKNTFKMGGTPELDSAGVFAAQLVVENRDYTELLTASSGTCVRYEAATRTFLPQDCDNGVAQHAGLLSHPGMNAHFMSNMAFRRTRWVQETFACTAFPAEHSAEPEQLSDTAVYTAPWLFESIAGAESGASIDFRDYQSVVCANCHATMNHIAPLFGNFDGAGQLSENIAVPKPIEGNPMTTLADWLPAGEGTAWRVDAPAADLVALGAVMAADPDIAECAVARAWNWAMGKGDVVDTLSLVPAEVFQSQEEEFIDNGYDFKTLLYRVFTSDDFVRF